jgi:hypothetical protein
MKEKEVEWLESKVEREKREMEEVGESVAVERSEVRFENNEDLEKVKERID